MIPKDCVKQLIKFDDNAEADYIDELCIQLSPAQIKDRSYPSVTIDFNIGKINCYDAEGKIIESFAINCTLEPITNE